METERGKKAKKQKKKSYFTRRLLITIKNLAINNFLELT